MKRLLLAFVALSVFTGTAVFAQPAATDTKQEQPKEKKKKKKGGKKKTETKKEETKS